MTLRSRIARLAIAHKPKDPLPLVFMPGEKPGTFDHGDRSDLSPEECGELAKAQGRRALLVEFVDPPRPRRRGEDE